MLETVRLLKGTGQGRVRGEFKIGCNLCGHPGKVHGGAVPLSRESVRASTRVTVRADKRRA